MTAPTRATPTPAAPGSMPPPPPRPPSGSPQVGGPARRIIMLHHYLLPYGHNWAWYGDPLPTGIRVQALYPRDWGGLALGTPQYFQM